MTHVIAGLIAWAVVGLAGYGILCLINRSPANWVPIEALIVAIFAAYGILSLMFQLM